MSVATNDLAKKKKFYEEEGYAIFNNVLGGGLIEECRGHVDWLIKKHPDTRPENLHTHMVREDPFWVRLISDPRLLDIAQQFIGPDIALFASHYICKPAGIGQPVLWHQDGSYWPLDPMEVVTLWLAVDDSVPENGCMRVIPRTQEMDLQENQNRDDVENVLGSSMDENLVDESKAVDIIFKAGDVSVHHPNVIHGSNANHSTFRRCGLTIRYIPTSTRVLKPEVASLFLLCGEDLKGVNEYLPKPVYENGKCFPFSGSENW